VTENALVREWEVPFPVDVRLTLSVHGRCPADPTFRVDDAGAVWRTSLTPEGPGTIRVRSTGQGARVVAHAWGPGAAWLLDAAPAALGFYDDISGFDPIAAHGVLREITARHPGVRVGRSGRLLEALVPAILEQKVTGKEAHRAWKFLLARFGTQSPGPAPAGMRVFPDQKTWRTVPSWDWHRAGVENVRAQTIFHVTSLADSLERLLDLAGAEADRKLRSIPGIGRWTSAEALQRAAGDPDAVSVGDYNLPKAVGWALAGRQSTDDATMLELLAPYAGHRYRVTRLVELSGRMPPRRGPRMSVRDYRGF
jgi:3-methyladenine DNA glycosylase/8-oxoguanine DNA glycosylase